MAACSGAPPSMLPSTGTQSAVGLETSTHATTGKALIVINVPANAPGARRRVVRHGRPSYISVATKGMTISFSRGAKVVVNEAVALTPGSKGCTTSAAGTRCGFAVKLQSCGKANAHCYVANISTYDAVTCSDKQSCTIPPGANVLSTEQRYPVGIVAGKKTPLKLTLAGVPVSTVVAPVDVLTVVNAQHGYDLLGLGAHVFAVSFLDADGATIVGAGSPALAVTPATGGLTPVTIATPSSSPNEVYVTPPTTFGGSATASFTVAPSFAGQATNGCSAPGAVCTPTPVAVDMVKMLAISTGSLELYALGSNTPVLSLGDGLIGVAFDPSGNIYSGGVVVGRYDNTTGLMVYSPPFLEGAPPVALDSTLIFLAQVPNAGAFALFSYNDSGTGNFAQLCSNATCTAGPNLGYANSVAADAAGDTAFSNTYSRGTCSIWVNGSQAVSIGSSPPCAQSIQMDPSGNVFFTIPNAYQVIEASKSSGYKTLTTISTGTIIPYQLAIDPNGNLLCAGQDSFSLAATLQYVSTATLSANQGTTVAPDRSITIATPPSGQGTALEALAIDAGQVYVQYNFLNGFAGQLATYALPSLTQVGTTQSNDGVAPTGLEIVP